jgi:hypothetical protein
MAKLKLLLLDANVIIEAHEKGVWENLTQSCEITITEAVKSECKYWLDLEGNRNYIDIDSYITKGSINCVEVKLTSIEELIAKFDVSYVDRLDPGETESLAFLFESNDNWVISSSDDIVYKILGAMNRINQGISLEEILNKIGVTKTLQWQFTKKFRMIKSKTGQIDSIQERGFVDKSLQ